MAVGGHGRRVRTLRTARRPRQGRITPGQHLADVGVSLASRSIRDAGPILGGLVLGIGAGITLERMVMTQESHRPDPEAGEPFGALRGRPATVESFDGTRLHLEELAPPADGPSGRAPTLVFSHGFSLRGDAWHYQRRDLSRRYRCVFLDLRGHGHSSTAPTGDYSLEAVAGDLAAVLDWTGEKRVVLVAHSMSGIAALKLIELQPDVQQRLAGLVLVDSTYTDNLRALAAALAARSGRVPTELAQQADDAGHRAGHGLPALPARAGLAVIGAAAKLAGQEPRLAHNLRRRGSDLGYIGTRLFGFGSNPSPSQVAFTDQLLAATDVRVWSQVLPALLDFDNSHLLARVTVPTLVAVGDKDRLTPVSAARHMADTIPDARLLVLPDSGHMAFMEEHELLDHAITTFVEEVTAR